MTQPPYGEPPGQPYGYPPPVDPFATTPPGPPPQAPPPQAPWSQPYQQPYPPQGYPAQTYPGQPYLPPPPPAPKKRRGLLITAIVLGVAVLLCGGGGTAAYLFLQNADGQGAQSPQVAVNDFLVAVYTDQDAAKAEKLVCSSARDRAELSRKINEVKSYAGKYKDPKFSWPEPTVAETASDSAKVNVKVKITTGDEKVAEQQLNFVVVKKTGWFVCEVQSG